MEWRERPFGFAAFAPALSEATLETNMKGWFPLTKDRKIAYAASLACGFVLQVFLLPPAAISRARAQTGPPRDAGVAVGAQYDSTHVYVAPSDLDAFVKSFVATFGGQPSAKTVTNVLPVPSSTEFQYLWTSVGALSVFAYQTPVPFPFGQERSGYLVTDMDQAIKAARSAGAEVIVEPFKDPIGRDAVIQWPGGVKMQLYWHFTPPQYASLEAIPDNRVYVSRDRADNFVDDFVRFAHGKVIEDDKRADAGEIGRAGETYRRIRITSMFGNMAVLVTDGHLPYPFGHELTGYQVQQLDATLEKAKAAGAKVLSAPYTTKDHTSAIVEFPGGYIAELHSVGVRAGATSR
jgi:predicted enzyme related to lactoylglutathione lyase